VPGVIRQIATRWFDSRVDGQPSWTLLCKLWMLPKATGEPYYQRRLHSAHGYRPLQSSRASISKPNV
jgi:hypothetical protein